MRAIIPTYVAGLVLLLASPLTSAATIDWLGVGSTSSPFDVAPFGSTVEAVNASTSSSGTVSVNGVTFSNRDNLLGDSFAGALAGRTSGDAGFDQLLNTFNFGGGTSTSITIADGELVAGRSYGVQVWYTDLRSDFDNRVMTVGDDNGNSEDLNASGTGEISLGQFAFGTFSATGTSQALALQSNGFANAHINAYQVREIPLPATWLLMVVGLFGGSLIAAARRNRRP